MFRKMSVIFMMGIFLSAGLAAAETYKIGVLAKRGPVKALKQWKATGDYLTEKITGKTFEIVPLDFEAVNPAIEKGEVDFFLVNSSMFVTAQVKFGALSRCHHGEFPTGSALKIVWRCHHHCGG